MYRNMSLLENIMDAEQSLCWVEHHSATTAGQGARRMGRTKNWDVDKAREVSEL